MTWREADHPRDSDGEFTDKPDWASRVSDRIGRLGVFSSGHGDEDTARRWATKHLEYTDRGTGSRSTVETSEKQDDGVTVAGAFHDGQTQIGTWEVTLTGDSVSVESIVIDPDHQGGGLGKRWVSRLEHGARAEGAARISMWDFSNGFWAKMGYGPGHYEGEMEKEL